MLYRIITLLIAKGHKPEYVMDLEIATAVSMAACYGREEARSRMAFLADVQLAVGSLLTKEAKIGDTIDALKNVAEGR